MFLFGKPVICGDDDRETSNVGKCFVYVGCLCLVAVMVYGVYGLVHDLIAVHKSARGILSQSEVAASEIPSPPELLSLNTVEEGSYVVLEMDNTSVPEYVALEVVGVSGNRYCLARVGEGLEISDKVHIRVIRIGKNPPYHLAEKVR